jgi:hypothetical protein
MTHVHLGMWALKKANQVVRGKQVTLRIVNRTGYTVSIAVCIGYYGERSYGWYTIRHDDSYSAQFGINPSVPMPVLVYARAVVGSRMLEWGEDSLFWVLEGGAFTIKDAMNPAYQVLEGNGRANLVDGYRVTVGDDLVSVLTPQ